MYANYVEQMNSLGDLPGEHLEVAIGYRLGRYYKVLKR